MIQLDRDFGMKVVNDHHSPSNIYGFVLYTESNPYVRKVMRDNDFWDEFDVKSGANWPIFSVKAFEDKKDSSYNHMACEFFNLNSADDLPCMIIFALDEKEKEVAYQRIYKIKGKTVDEVHQSILSVIESVAEVEKVIRENNDKGIETTPFVAWEASKSIDKLEIKDCFREGFYGIGKLSEFIFLLGKLFIKV